MTTEIFNVQDAYIGMYSNSFIMEKVHQEIKDIMDNVDIPVSRKLSAISTKTKSLIKSGQNTGMESDKATKGSCRAVFFPKEHKEITVDGIKTKTPTAVKIAFAGTLDKHHGESTTLGEDQNAMESDHYVNRTYGILHHADGNYHSSHDDSGGVLSPVFETHPEHHHLEMGRVDKCDAKSIADATKTKEFPKGLKHDEIYSAMMHEHEMAHGQGKHYTEEHNDKMDNIKQHPWVNHAISMMHETGMHPGDMNKRNMGIYTHPVTGKKHLAIIDYGFGSDIAKKYQKGRKNYYESRSNHYN